MNDREKRRAWKIAGGLTLGLCAALVLFSLAAPGLGSRGIQSLAKPLDQLTGKRLTLASSAEGGSLLETGRLLAKAVERTTIYPLDIIPSQGSGASLELLASGAADLAFVSGWRQEALAETRGLARLGPQYVHLIVALGAEINGFRDLAGLRVGIGPEGGEGAALAREVFGFLRLDPPVRLITGHSRDLEEAFLRDQIDAAFSLHGLFDAEMEELFATGWYRLIPLPEASTLAAYIPGIRAEALPSGLYGPERNVPPGGMLLTTLAVDTLLVARPDMPTRQVRAVMAGLYAPEFRVAARLDRITESDGRRLALAPLHPAAEAYYLRDAPLRGEEALRLAVLLFLLLILAAGAPLAMKGLGKLRAEGMRKAFLPYFEQLSDFGETIESSDDLGELSQVLLDMSTIQRQAEYEWLRGRLDDGDMDKFLAFYGARSQMAYSKIQILLIAGETVASSPPRPAMDREEKGPSRASHSGGRDSGQESARDPKSAIPHAPREAQEVEAPRSEIIEPNTLRIKTEAGMRELPPKPAKREERETAKQAPQPPKAAAKPAAKPAATPPREAPAAPVRTEAKIPRPSAPPPVVKPDFESYAPTAATPEWVASFEDASADEEVKDEDTGGDAKTGATIRAMDPRQASANLYPGSARLAAAMEQELNAEREAAENRGFRWLNTGVGEGLSVPRPRRPREVVETPAEVVAADTAHEAEAVEDLPAPAPQKDDSDDSDVELDSPVAAPAREETSAAPEPLAAPEALAAPEPLAAPDSAVPPTAAGEADAATEKEEAASSAPAPREKGNRRRRKKARKKEQVGQEGTKPTGRKPAAGSADKGDGKSGSDKDDDQLSFF